MSPTVLHLLGRWKDAQLVFTLPSRTDLWRRNVNEQEAKPYIVVNDLLLCTEDDHQHFLTADTELFPGNEDRMLNRNRPEPEYYNWTPMYRENSLVNWNLDAEQWEAEAQEHFEDVGLASEEEEEEEGDRVRRQAPPPTPPPVLEQNQIMIQLICRGPVFKVEIPNSYRLYLKSVVQHLATKQVEVVREYFQNIWKPEHSWNVQLISAHQAEEERYKVRFTVPAHGILIFNDVSLMQALGFDSVGPNFKQDPFAIRINTKTDGTKIYYWNNNSTKARVYESLRTLPNKPMFKLRGLAEEARILLPASVLATAPKIITQGTENLNLPFILQFEYVKALAPLTVENTLKIHPSMGGAMEKMTAYQAFFQDLLNQMALKDQLDAEAFHVQIVDASYLQFEYHKTGEKNFDRFSVRMYFGYDSAVQLTFFEQPQLEWNLGRQSTKAYKMLYTAEEMEAHREAAVQQQFEIENIDPEEVLAVGGATAIQTVTTSVDPLAAGAGATETEEILEPTEQVDPADVARRAEQILPPTTVFQPAEREEEDIEIVEEEGETGMATGEIEEEEVEGTIEEQQPPTEIVEPERPKAQPDQPEIVNLPPVQVIKPTSEDLTAQKKAAEEARAAAAKRKADEAARQAEISERIKQKRLEDEQRRQKEINEALMADLAEKQRKADLERDRLQRLQIAEQNRREAEERQRQIDEQNRREAEERQRLMEEQDRQLQILLAERAAEAEAERRRQILLAERLAEEEEERQRQILLAEAEEPQAPVQIIDPEAGAGDVPAPAPAGAGDAPVNPYLGEPQPAAAADQGTFRRDRLRYLVGNTRRKRRMPAQEPPFMDRPENMLLILDNSEKQNDFIYEWGRCCVAANIQGGKVVSKIKCFVDVRNEQELIFNLLDSQHLCLVRSPAQTLAKIEIHVYV